MSNTHEFSDETFDDFLDSLPEVEPPARMKDAVFENIDAAGDAEVVELPRRRWRAFVAVPAAAAVLVVGVVAAPQLLQLGQPDAADSARVEAESPGEKSMHAIMGAEDLMQGNADASGAQLDIVSSASMAKSGAMVDGQPQLADGMGAQVWAVSAGGDMASAGVIGQDPHDGVWMPFDGAAVKVMVTEEPVGGSAQPTGRTLATVTLASAG
ncbi:anti-sigma factor [Corynebacterium minutissimum]|uniref:Anti-sigma factor n=1 Tax=Corynebacterium minutissimum TaxID=38301 RepID=A0A2X4RFM2_9CORY|nr:anti-sigma factor [Corynebacterium minutissimum]KHO29961.1 anti-sigma-K factor [Corynebacterium minutissimum]MCG7229195.1 anti-sigma factor [Corynebacterium minutissimum]MCG7238942.1 anti-sigma factor [Corynebacterium minutissimum]QPS60440.1 anti-sigma factor [Corynebacterium minutissimum]QQA78771.1 anti-sigma factor [Corynebacterium minutissimum]